MNKKFVSIAATVALLVGGAGYFTASTVKDAEIKEIKSEQVMELTKVRDKSLKVTAEWEAAYDTKQEVCANYKDKSEEVVQGLLNALDVSTDMISTPGDLVTTMAYSTVADGITSLIATKDEMESLAVQCAGATIS